MNRYDDPKKADFYQLDYGCVWGEVYHTETFKYLDDLIEEFMQPLEQTDSLFKSAYAVYEEDGEIVRFPFNPYDIER